MTFLELKDVNKKYPKFELKNISFKVEPGSIVGFIGRNGAGKTTTLKGIMDLIHFDSGDVFMFDENFREHEIEFRQYIAFSLSEINFYPQAKIKTLVNVTKRFYKNWNQETYDKLLKRFDLDENKKICELSSGMKVKYNLLIALSHDAKLLILDEPTSGLDPVSRDEILDIFKALVKNKDRSILFSTHITSDLEKCATDIVYIKKGEIISSKSKSSFISDYRLLSGSISEYNSIKNIAISHKEDEKEFTALIDVKDLDKVPSTINVKEPDLEEVMIYHERSEKDEEFII